MIIEATTLLGFFSAIIPEGLKFWKDTKDKKHEIELLKLQMESSKNNHKYKLEAIEAEGDARIFQQALKNEITNIPFIEFIRGSVRPIITYALFTNYVIVKWILLYFARNDLNLATMEKIFWNDFDKALLSVVVGFWFGQRIFKRR